MLSGLTLVVSFAGSYEFRDTSYTHDLIRSVLSRTKVKILGISQDSLSNVLDNKNGQLNYVVKVDIDKTKTVIE